MCKDHSSFWQLLFLWHCAWLSYQHTSQNVTSPRDSHRGAVSRHCSNHKSVSRWQPAEKLAPTSFSSSFLLSFSSNTWKVLFNHRISERFCNHSNLLSSFTSRNLIPTVISFSAHFFSFHKVSYWKGLKTLLSYTLPSLPGIIFFAMLLWTWKTGFMKLSSPTV